MVSQRIKQIAEKIGAKPWTQPEEQEIDPDTPIPVPNRHDKRRAKRYNGISGTTEVHDILRLGTKRRPGKTGSPHWFRLMKYEAAKRKTLEKVATDRLEPAVGKIALDLHAAGYDNVWKVCEVRDVNDFLKHGQAGNPEHGIRGVDLIRLRAYLEQQGLSVQWEI